MTAREIGLTFMHDRFARNLCLPNYTPQRWFECDVFEVSEAGYFREYEIKLSRSDFFADANKSGRNGEYLGIGKGHRILHKHQALAVGEKVGPNYFTFIMPDGLVDISEIPEWAGLIVASVRERSYQIPHRIALRRVKDGRRLHTHKIDPAVWSHARGVCYYRYHHAILEAERRDKKELSAPVGTQNHEQ